MSPHVILLLCLYFPTLLEGVRARAGPEKEKKKKKEESSSSKFLFRRLEALNALRSLLARFAAARSDEYAAALQEITSRAGPARAGAAGLPEALPLFDDVARALNHARSLRRRGDLSAVRRPQRFTAICKRQGW